jgi:hypothetical protein
MTSCECLHLGASLDSLITDQAAWSQATFGTDAERGPVGAFRHLEKETREVIAAYAQVGIVPGAEAAFLEECADCFILLLDGIRRGGITFPELVAEARRKMGVNKTRKWPKPTAADVPVEHVRD